MAQVRFIKNSWRLLLLTSTIIFTTCLLVILVNHPVSAQSNTNKTKPETKQECRRWHGTVVEDNSNPYNKTWECVDYVVPTEGTSEDITADDDTDKQVIIDKEISPEECVQKGGKQIYKTSADGRPQAYSHCELGGDFKPIVDTGNENQLNNKETSTCVIAGYGWLFCPVLNFTSKLSDILLNALTPFLEYESLANQDSYRSLFKVWGVFRNIANIGFVIAFLVIIFSQTSGLGMNSYSIKRMLPRLVVVSIITNLSLPLAALAIDISNIIGASAKDLLESIAIQNNENTTLEKITAGILAGTTVTGIGTATAIGVGGLMVGGAYYGLLGVLGPVVIASVIALFIVLVILVARQAFLTVLVVIMPVALMFQLFRGTDNYWKKWNSYFVNMLLVYPVVSVIFGVAMLASRVMMISGKDNAIMGILAIGTQALPLFSLPIILRSLSKMGGAIGLASKASNYFNSKVGDNVMGKIERQQKLAAASKTKKLTDKLSQSSSNSHRFARTRRFANRIITPIAGGSLFRQAQDEATSKALDNMLEQVSTRHHLESLVNNPRYLKQLTGRSKSEATRKFQAVLKAKANEDITKLNNAMVEAHEIVMSSISTKELQGMMYDQNLHETQKVAILNQLTNRGEMGGAHGAVAYAQTLIYRNTPNNFSSVIAEGVSKMTQKQMPGVISSEASQAILQPPQAGSLGVNLHAEMERAMKNDEVSPENIASMSKETLEYVINTASEESKDMLREAALVAVEEEKISSKLENYDYIYKFAHEKAPSDNGRYSRYKAAKNAQKSNNRNRNNGGGGGGGGNRNRNNNNSGGGGNGGGGGGNRNRNNNNGGGGNRNNNNGGNNNGGGNRNRNQNNNNQNSGNNDTGNGNSGDNTGGNDTPWDSPPWKRDLP